MKTMGELLYLDSGTLTPMLKRMEQNGLIIRERSKEDERSVQIRLTEYGEQLKEKATAIPSHMLSGTGRSEEELKTLRASLHELLAKFNTTKRLRNIPSAFYDVYYCATTH